MNIGTLIATLGVDTSGLVTAQTAMLNFQKTTIASLNTTAQRFRTFGYLATAAVTAPMVMAGKAAMKMAKDYEYSMQKIVGLTGIAQSAVDEWSAAVLKMAPKLARPPQELMDALYFISSSGIKGAEAMKVLEMSAKAATAGLGRTEQVANLLTSVLNAYAGTGMTAAYATDILVAAVREGKAEADQFATSIGSVIPYAAQLKVPFDQVAGAMAAMTLSGASAANAATYLRNFLMKLIKPAKQSVDALEGLGMSFSDLRKIVAEQGLMAALEQVRVLTEKYGVETLGKIFPNIRALMLYLSLAGKNMKYNSELMQRVTESTGSLGKAFAAVADTIKVRYDVAISTAQVSLISLGKSVAEGFLPLLEKLIKKLGEVTVWFNNLSDAEKQNKLVLLAWIAAAGPLSLAISLVMYTLSSLVSVVRFAIIAFNGLRIAMLANPWTLAIAGVSLAVGWLLRFKRKSDEAALAQDSFNTALVKVNGSLKLLKSLTDVDFTAMNVTELVAVMEVANKQYMLAKKNIKDIQDRVAAGAQGKAGMLRYVDIQIDKAIKAKKVYEEAAAALKAWGDNFGITGSSMIGFTEDVDDLTERLEGMRNILDQLADPSKLPKAIPMKEYMEALGLSQLAKGPKMPIIDFDLTVMDTLQKELAEAAFLESFLGDTFDETSAQIQAHMNAIMALYKAYPEGHEAIDGLIDKYNELIATQDELTFSARRMGSIVADSIINMTEAIGSSFANAENAILSMAQVLLQTGQRIIQMLLAEAVATLFLASATLAQKEVARRGLPGLITAAIGIAALLAMITAAQSSIKSVSKFASGTNYAPGGLALVGERGPELVNLPRGSQVFPTGTLGRQSEYKEELVARITGKQLDLVLRRYYQS